MNELRTPSGDQLVSEITKKIINETFLFPHIISILEDEHSVIINNVSTLLKEINSNQKLSEKNIQTFFDIYTNAENFLGDLEMDEIKNFVLNIKKLLEIVMPGFRGCEVQETVGDCTEKAAIVLDIHEGGKKCNIFVNNEEREIHLDYNNLRVDSIGWEEIDINLMKVKISPTEDIIEFPQINGEQMFTWDAAIRESKKVGKRLLSTVESNPEFQGVIERAGLKEFELFSQEISGTYKGQNLSINNKVGYWSSSKYAGDARHFLVIDNKLSFCRDWGDKGLFQFVRCALDDNK